MTHISIIGAGIGGLAAAIGLARAGHDVSIFEQADKIDEVGAGLQLSPNAVQALKALGAYDAVMARASVSNSMRMFSGDEHLNTLDLQALGEHYKAPFLVMHRADLQGALLEVAQGLPNIELHLGHRLTGIKGNALTFENGTTHTAHAIVGSDGVHSRLRELIFGTKSVPTGLVAWRGMAALEPGDTHVDLHLMPHAHAVTYPLPHVGMRNLVVIGASENLFPLMSAEALAKGDEGGSTPRSGGMEVNTAMTKFITPSVSHSLASPPLKGGQFLNSQLLSLTPTISNWTHWPLSIVPPMPTWTRGNITLLGDAAHAMPPFAAQGACMALEDAAVLMHACANENFPQAFQAYERARKKRCEQVQALSIRNGRIYHYSGIMGRMRDFSLRTGAEVLLRQRMDWVWGWKKC